MMLHKIRSAMVRPDRDPIGAGWPVEVDETLIGGRTRGKGKGKHQKIYVVGAVEVRKLRKGEELPVPEPSGPPRKRGLYAGRIRLRVLPARDRRSVEPFVKENIQKGTVVKTDGWQGYDNLAEMGYNHEGLAMDSDTDLVEAHLPMIHIAFSNLKTWLNGTHHGVSQKHLQAYLNEYVFRFNRRFYPMTAFHSVLGIGTTKQPPTYDAIYSGEWAHPNPTKTGRNPSR
jgi:transposase-like protein